MASFPSAIKTFSTITNGVTKLVAALFNSPNDEITAIETQLGVNMAGVRLGAWDGGPYVTGTHYKASTDGFVIANAPSTNTGSITIYTDSNNPPTTFRIDFDYSVTGGLNPPIFCPVKKNDYWQIDVSGGAAGSIYWIPFGS